MRTFTIICLFVLSLFVCVSSLNEEGNVESSSSSSSILSKGNSIISGLVSASSSFPFKQFFDTLTTSLDGEDEDLSTPRCRSNLQSSLMLCNSESSNKKIQIKPDHPLPFKLPNVDQMRKKEIRKRQGGDGYCSGAGTLSVKNQTKIECPNEKPYNSTSDVLCTNCTTQLCYQKCCNSTVNTVYSCRCFEGRFGSQCENYDRYECNFNLISPSFDCSRDNPTCKKYSIKDQITVEYRMDCKFEKNESKSFENFVNLSQEMFSSRPIIMHIFDFRRFYDFSVSPIALASPKNFLSQENLKIDVLFENITNQRRFISGGRIYYELRFLDEDDQQGLINHPVDRKYIDFVDFPIPGESAKASESPIIYIALSIVVVLIVILAIMYLYRDKIFPVSNPQPIS